MSNSIDQNLFVLRQGMDLLRSVSPELYAETPEGAEGPPAIGPHVRHCVDFYLCFLSGLDLRVVDYSSRGRRPEVETDRDAALAALSAVAEGLGKIEDRRLDEPMEVRAESAAEGESDASWSASSVHRELQFLLSHTVHHYALIALSLRLRGQQVPAEFGVAPSTLAHWRRQGRCVR